ncbi:MAG: hypothetical protein LBB87_01095 [Nitrososphaerota archaeon]|jgi:signal peptidase I|nr:hypothetical protein [Nitrososphaerota archaeon]
MATVKKLWQNDIFRTAVTLALIPIIIIGFWGALPRALNTDIFPLFVVVSGSMCIPAERCNGNLFSHTFERTLHVGDILIIQGVDAKDLKTNYPDSDIIVFRNPTRATNDPEANIVHRIIDSVEVDGKLYFHTKGDGNGYPNVWPQTPQSRDPWHSVAEDPTSTYDNAISQDYIYGKVVMRIPWIGAIAMQSQKNNMITVILGILTALLIIVEFILPLIKKRKRQNTKTITITNEEPPTQDAKEEQYNSSTEQSQ